MNPLLLLQQFENQFDLTPPDPNKTFYIYISNVNSNGKTDSAISAGITLLMKVVLIYDKHPHLFHAIIDQLSLDEINQKNNIGWTALMIACQNCGTSSNRIECAKSLINHGADLHITNPCGWTPLMSACRYSRSDSSVECVKMLLQHGANVKAQNNQGWTPLMLSCRNSSVECVKLIITEMHDNNTITDIINLQNNDDGHTALTLICNGNTVDHESVECVKLLLSYGADPNVQMQNGETLLMIVCTFCDTSFKLEIVSLLLLQYQANPTLTNSNGWNALHIACRYGKTLISTQCISMLLQSDKMQKQHICAKTNGGMTPLMLSCTSVNADSTMEHVQLLLNNNNNNNDNYVNDQNNEGYSALMMSCQYAFSSSNIQCSRLLLKHGADVNLRGMHNANVLILLVHSFHLTPTLPTTTSSLSLQARRNLCLEFLHLLCNEYHADINMIDQLGWSALIADCSAINSTSDSTIVCFLLQQPNITLHYALMIAFYATNPVHVRLLISKGENINLELFQPKTELTNILNTLFNKDITLIDFFLECNIKIPDDVAQTLYHAFVSYYYIRKNKTLEEKLELMSSVKQLMKERHFDVNILILQYLHSNIAL